MTRQWGVRVAGALMMLSSGVLAGGGYAHAQQGALAQAVYQQHFDVLFERNLSALNRQAASGDGYTYYHFSYVLDGMVGMFEGTGDVKYLEQALTWAGVMVSRATVIDMHGKRNWRGTWESRYAGAAISHHLYDLQGATQLARLARVVLVDPVLSSHFGKRAEDVYRFVKEDIADKWRYSRNGEQWYRSNAASRDQEYSDKTALFVRILVDLFRVDRSASHLSLAQDLLEAFLDRTEWLPRRALIWDRGVNFTRQKPRSLDTSHANRIPYMMADAHDASIVITKVEIDGLARLLTEIIWNQSTSSPRFTNFIDGSNASVFGRPPYGIGQIYSGWVALGAYDERVQSVAEAVLFALLSGVRNPSLDYMRGLGGQLCLIGHVVRNRAVLNKE